jgi:hypothetical protein
MFCIQIVALLMPIRWNYELKVLKLGYEDSVKRLQLRANETKMLLVTVGTVLIALAIFMYFRPTDYTVINLQRFFLYQSIFSFCICLLLCVMMLPLSTNGVLSN